MIQYKDFASRLKNAVFRGVIVSVASLLLASCAQDRAQGVAPLYDIPVYFGVDSAELTAPAREALDAVAVRIKNREAERVRIVGYAVGRDDDALAVARAEAIRAALTANGVDPDILRLDWETLPEQDADDNAAPMIATRRGEIVIRFE